MIENIYETDVNRTLYCAFNSIDDFKIVYKKENGNLVEIIVKQIATDETIFRLSDKMKLTSSNNDNLELIRDCFKRNGIITN